MKKFISFALVLVLCLSLFAGCSEQPADNTSGSVGTTGATQPTEDNALELAIEYIYTMYKPASKNEPTKLTMDKEVLSVVVIDGVSYAIEWTVAVTSGTADGVTVGESSTANMVKIDIMDQPEEELYYTATATVKDDQGNTESVSFDFYTPAVKKVDISDDGKVVIYNPNDGKYVTDIDYLYTSSSSGNQKHELELTEDKASAVALTVEQNDDGSVNFVTDSGLYLFCDGNNVQFVDEQGEYTKFFLEAAEGGQYIKSNAVAYDKPQYIEVYSGYLTCYGMNAEKTYLYTFELQTVNTVSQSAILDAAYSLGTGEALEGTYTLTGEITKVNTAWSEDYQNITVTIVCDDDAERPVQCFRLKGDGAKDLAEGDKITVTGTIKNYNGTIEFDAGCNLDKVVKAEGNEPTDEPVDEPDDPVVPDVDNTGDVTLANGMQVVIYAPAYGKALSVEKTGFYNVGVDVTVDGTTLTGYGDSEIFTVIDNGDGTWSFANGGQNIGLADQYSSMDLGAVNDKWTVTSLGDGLYLITNVGREGMCMEWYNQYSNWSTYGPSDPAADDQFQMCFYVVAE